MAREGRGAAANERHPRGLAERRAVAVMLTFDFDAETLWL
jgi:hypothetical protein